MVRGGRGEMDYYNDVDPFCCNWLRNLCAEGLIPNGRVHEASIHQLAAPQVLGRRQCHFFAGIGGWAYALRLAGWPEDLGVWTASLPCQPFSEAGSRRGFADERHLWPVFRCLVEECRPPILLGEQVA